MRFRWSRPLRILSAASLVWSGACDSSDVGRCAGQGTVLESAGNLYCVYAGAPSDVRDSTSCGDDAPQRIVLRDSVVCAPAGSSAGELPDEVCVAAGSGCGSAFAGPPVTWSALEDFPGGPRSGVAAVFDLAGRRVVTFGGVLYEDELLFYADTWALDVDTGSWRELSIPDGPSERTLAAATHDPTANRMVLMGGYDRNELSDVWALDLETERWSPLPSLPVVLDSAAATFAAGRVWLFGGSRDGGIASDSLLRLAGGPGEWELVPGVGPSARIGASLAGNRGSELWLVGGAEDRPDAVSLRDIWRYSITENRWTLLDTTAGVPAPTYSGYVVDEACGVLVLVGGADGTDAHASVRALSMDTGTVAFMDPLPAPRYGAAVALDPVSRRLFVIGGEVAQDEQSASVYVGQLGACP